MNDAQRREAFFSLATNTFTSIIGIIQPFAANHKQKQNPSLSSMPHIFLINPEHSELYYAFVKKKKPSVTAFLC